MNQILKKYSFKHKNNKFLYYLINYSRLLIPDKIYLSQLEKKLAAVRDYDIEYLKERAYYYNKLSVHSDLSDNVRSLRSFRHNKHNTYYFDCMEYAEYFKPGLRMGAVFGDVTFVPGEPSIVKSRPLAGDNSNSIILKLDKVRHFTFVRDKKDFRKKKNMLVCRNYAVQDHRLRFLEMYVNNPMCNVGKINRDGGHPDLVREMLTIDEQLDYKFILCLEGNDVATNLKWVMSSQSLAVMPLPRYETWFMEGKLIPDFHFVQIKDDYSDLEERLQYYIHHTDQAIEIIKNANRYIEQFKMRKREDLISLMVLDKYFYMTNQTDHILI